MAIVFPKAWNTEALSWFATEHLGCLEDDVSLLKEKCETLILDVLTVCDFVWDRPHSPFSNPGKQSAALSATAFPIQYYQGLSTTRPGNLPAVATDINQTLGSETTSTFHRASLLSLRQRLQVGKSALRSLNEKYGFGFSVRGSDEGGSKGLMKGKVGWNEGCSLSSDTAGAPKETAVKENSLVGGSVSQNQRSLLYVNASFAAFIQAFNALLRWVSTAINVLDDKRVLPPAGYYVFDGVPQCSTDQRNCRQVSENVKCSSATSEMDSDKPSVEGWQYPFPELASSDRVEPTADMRHVHTVQVSVYEIHDVRSVFLRYEGRLNMLFDYEYTFYDRRVKRRLLLPEYYKMLQELVDELSDEVERLERLEFSLAQGRSSDVTITFRPSVSEFRYMRDSLILYWSLCVTEDDITAFEHHSIQHGECLSEAAAVFEILKGLRRPQVETPGASQRSVYTQEQREALGVGFESYWHLRERVLELRDSLKRDIKNKNRTHRYCTPESLSTFYTGTRGETTSVERIVRHVWDKLISWGELFSCAAELPDVFSSPGDTDEKFVTSINSPQYELKMELLGQIGRLVDAVEAQGAKLEQDYPGTFYRDAKSLWKQRASRVIRRLEVASVIFPKNS